MNSRKIRFLTCWLVAMSLIAVVASVHAGETQGTDDAGRDYFVYTPDTIDPDKTYTLILAVHGYRGNGRGGAGMRGYVNEFDCIVLSPSFNSNGYQYLGAGANEQALGLIAQLRDEYNLHEKIFVTGFSGGSQFAHRFAMAHPNLVAGCAAHSGGTWGTGDYDDAVPNPAARSVLFVISCGMNDTGKSFGEAPLGRLEWAQRYATMLEDGGFLFDAQWFEGVGHNYSGGARQMTRDCFVASTQLLPELAEQSDAIDGLIRGNEYAAAWDAVRACREQAEASDEGIAARVHEAFIASLDPAVERIDRWAQSQVRRAIRDNRDRDSRRQALSAMREEFEGLPDETRLIVRALGE